MQAILKARIDLVLLVSMQAFFVTYPTADLVVSGWLYSKQTGFIYRDQPIVVFVYELFACLHIPIIAVLIWLLFASWRWRRTAESLLRRRLCFLLLVLAIGPGLLVNGLLKGQSGRARPYQVEQFGGRSTFTGAFQPASNCVRNCSFVSGHASLGFFFIAFAWVFRDRRWLWFGILLGTAVGLGRMLQGRHFLSDVVFAYWVVYASCVLLASLLLRQKRIVV